MAKQDVSSLQELLDHAASGDTLHSFDIKDTFLPELRSYANAHGSASGMAAVKGGELELTRKPKAHDIVKGILEKIDDVKDDLGEYSAGEAGKERLEKTLAKHKDKLKSKAAPLFTEMERAEQKYTNANARLTEGADKERILKQLEARKEEELKFVDSAIEDVQRSIDGGVKSTGIKTITVGSKSVDLAKDLKLKPDAKSGEFALADIQTALKDGYKENLKKNFATAKTELNSFIDKLKIANQDVVDEIRTLRRSVERESGLTAEQVLGRGTTSIHSETHNQPVSQETTPHQDAPRGSTTYVVGGALAGGALGYAFSSDDNKVMGTGIGATLGGVGGYIINRVSMGAQHAGKAAEHMFPALSSAAGHIRM